jgi:hypothetical protein
MGWVELDAREFRDGVYTSYKKKRRPSPERPKPSFQTRQSVLDRSKLIPVDHSKSRREEAEAARLLKAQNDAFAEELKNRKPNKKGKKRDVGIKLMVEVRVATRGEDGNEEISFPLSVGEGEQTVKWLGMAASQRFQNRQPKGAQRGRDRVKVL